MGYCTTCLLEQLNFMKSTEKHEGMDLDLNKRFTSALM
jgi:hypothetical protein